MKNSPTSKRSTCTAKWSFIRLSKLSSWNRMGQARQFDEWRPRYWRSFPRVQIWCHTRSLEAMDAGLRWSNWTNPAQGNKKNHDRRFVSTASSDPSFSPFFPLSCQRWWVEFNQFRFPRVYYPLEKLKLNLRDWEVELRTYKRFETECKPIFVKTLNRFIGD